MHWQTFWFSWLTKKWNWFIFHRLMMRSLFASAFVRLVILFIPHCKDNCPFQIPIKMRKLLPFFAILQGGRQFAISRRFLLRYILSTFFLCYTWRLIYLFQIGWNDAQKIYGRYTYFLLHFIVPKATEERCPIFANLALEFNLCANLILKPPQ